MKLHELMQKINDPQKIIVKDRNEPHNIYPGSLFEVGGSWIFQDMEVTNIWTKGPYLVIEVER